MKQRNYLTMAGKNKNFDSVVSASSAGDWELHKNSLFRFSTEKQAQKDKLNFRFGKSFLTFVVLGVLAIFVPTMLLPQLQEGILVKERVLGAATTGFDFLSAGEGQLLNQEFGLASSSFLSAGQSFELSRRQLQEAGGVFSQLLQILPQGRDVDALFKSGKAVTEALEALSLGLDAFQNTQFVWDKQVNTSGREFYTHLVESRKDILVGLQKLNEAAELVTSINPNLVPDQYRSQFEESGAKLFAAKSAVQGLADVEELLIRLLGGQEKTYLLLFLNNNELRAGGGFPGTYGLLVIGNGQMKLERIESIYQLDGQLLEKNIRFIPPWPMQRMLTDYWGLRDSNWFVDFPSSSRKALMFLEIEDNRLADGVIAMTPNVFEELLKITGPVAMPTYNEILSADNFRSIVQFKTSLDYDRKENRPKKFLADFAPLFLDKLKAVSGTEWLQMTELLHRMITEKQLLMFSLDSEIQTLVEKYGAGGEIKKTGGDYLGIFQSNVGGGKTDLGISQTVQKKVEFSRDGTPGVTLRITRTNNGAEEKFFPTNIGFVRILVPYGSRLISASGFDDVDFVYRSEEAGARVDSDVKVWDEALKWNPAGAFEGVEAGYTEFAGWMELGLGISRTVELKYELPWKAGSAYTHLLQKQSGAKPYDFSLEVDFPKTPVYVYPADATVNGTMIKIFDQTNTDKFYGAVMGE